MVLRDFLPGVVCEFSEIAPHLISIHCRDKLKEGGILTEAIYAGLKEAQGVSSVYMKPYHIHLFRSLAYPWKEILENIRPILVRYLLAV